MSQWSCRASARVLVFGDPGDTTLKFVIGHLTKFIQAEVTVVSSAEFCVDMPAFSFASGKTSFETSKATAGDPFDVIWNRRTPQPVLPSDLCPSHKEYAQTNWDDFLFGLKVAIRGKWLNDPLRHRQAANKLFQLGVAPSYGFDVPPSLVTNNPNQVREFVKAHGFVVCKTLINQAGMPSLGTVMLNDRHMADIDLLVSSPCIFQVFIPADKDIRVTVVGDELFAAETRTSEAFDTLDWRFDPNNPWAKHKLPGELEERCRKFVRELGLVYGAIDLRLDPDGKYHYFEINPGGQFLFIEAWTEHPIARSLGARIAGMAAENRLADYS